MSGLSIVKRRGNYGGGWVWEDAQCKWNGATRDNQFHLHFNSTLLDRFSRLNSNKPPGKYLAGVWGLILKHRLRLKFASFKPATLCWRNLGITFKWSGEKRSLFFVLIPIIFFLNLRGNWARPLIRFTTGGRGNCCLNQTRFLPRVTGSGSGEKWKKTLWTLSHRPVPGIYISRNFTDILNC